LHCRIEGLSGSDSRVGSHYDPGVLTEATASQSPARLLPPYFTGGTGRSGTTIIANLLQRHPALARTRPWESRFLTDGFGLCDLVEAKRWPWRLVAHLRYGNSLELFERRLRGQWFRRTAGNGKVVGLHQGIDEAALNCALDGFRQRFRINPEAASARLTHELLDPPARAAGKPRWIETTPDNAARAGALLQIFPDLRLVHMIRDGRDVAASVAARYWGPDDINDALDWWGKRMLLGGWGVAKLPRHQLLTIQLEDLVLRRREETLHKILTFLDLEPVEAVMQFHAKKMLPEHAHLSRWASEMDASARTQFDRRYEAILQRLTRAGVPVPNSLTS
jgi:Sulfotransferase family